MLLFLHALSLIKNLSLNNSLRALPLYKREYYFKTMLCMLQLNSMIELQNFQYVVIALKMETSPLLTANSNSVRKLYPPSTVVKATERKRRIT